MNREVHSVNDVASRFFAPLLPLVVAVGCSSGQVAPRPIGVRGPHASDRSQAAHGGQRPVRPIPDVITKPKAFRLSAPQGGAAAATPVAHVEPAPVAEPHTSARRLAAAAENNPTVAEVRAMLRSYLRAFNRHDAAALAAHWSETGENLDLDSGEVTAAGRQAVRDVFASLFAADDDATIDIDVHSIRPIRDDVAVVDGVSLISFADGTPASSRFSAVVVRQDGHWVLENVREAAAPTPPAGPSRPLEQLDWLVGSWEDDGAGVTASTRCAWSPGRGFLVRSHVITPDAAAPRPESGDDRIPALLPTADTKPRELTEIIGWDPDQDAIRSWIFAADGRFAAGVWERAGDRWTVRVEGRGRDEGAAATCTIEPAGDGLAIRCEADRLAPLLPPACSFTRTAR
jgi:uncharacterized protein (TIGR02246 family)